MSRLLDGKAVAAKLREDLKQRLSREFGDGPRPGLAVLLLADDAASRKYAQSKAKSCAELGLECTIHDMAGQHGNWRDRLRELGNDPKVHGIMIEQPLPRDVDPLELYGLMPAEKDVEGVSQLNLGQLVLGHPRLVASTPAAVMAILDHYEVPLAGRRAVVVGRSNVVGKPLVHLLLARDATVTCAHSRTTDLVAETSRADVLIVAAGVPHLIGPQHVRQGAHVIDVGINFKDGRMVGDVDTDAVLDKVAAITPVPGGVGPVTTVLLLSNLVEAATHQRAPTAAPRA